ncbi:hypothetical protein ASH09_12160 [Agrobacterium radiobacter]|nr:hypothetical protein ASH09_12160 [Agrobacterium radiobacter]
MDWYKGRYVAHENDPRSSVVIIGGSYERHWTARVAHKVVEFWSAHWQWTIGTVLALIALYFAISKD